MTDEGGLWKWSISSCFMVLRRKPLNTFCEREAVASLRQSYLRSFFLGPENNMNLNIGAIWNFSVKE